MKLLSCSLVGLLIAAAFQTSAFARDDVRSKDSEDPYFIKVERVSLSGMEMVSFQLCLKEVPEHCDVIGPSQYYEIDQLRSQRFYENLQIGLSGLGTVAVVVGGAWAGGAAGMAMAGSGGSYIGEILGMMIFGGGGMVAGGAIAGTVSQVIDVTSAWNQLQQRRAIRDAVIEDEEVVVRGSVKKLSKRLATVLEKLD